MFQIDHIAISVAHLPQSLSFYEALGFRIVSAYEEEDESLRLYLMENKAGALLEIFHYTDSLPAPVHTYEVRTDLPVVGVKHFALRVASLAAAQEALRDKGFVEGVEIKKGRLGRNYFFISDPNGIQLEIIETNSLR